MPDKQLDVEHWTVDWENSPRCPESPGKARGQALIITNPSEVGDYGRGHVPVAPQTDPAWTPLISQRLPSWCS